MNREQAITIARNAALNYEQRAAYSYLPVDEAQAANWMPHGWVIEAIMHTAQALGTVTIERPVTEPLLFVAAEASRLQQMFTEKPDLHVAVEMDDNGKLVAIGSVPGEPTGTLVMLSEGGDLRDTLADDPALEDPDC